MLTFKPRLLSRQPRDAAVMPFPRLETTPPVIKINFAITVSLPFWPTAAPARSREKPSARTPWSSDPKRKRNHGDTTASGGPHDHDREGTRPGDKKTRRPGAVQAGHPGQGV